jgi:hypothetical protein
MQAATSGDLLRASFANATQTPADRIYVYQTRTINSAAGQPSTEVRTGIATACWMCYQPHASLALANMFGCHIGPKISS